MMIYHKIELPSTNIELIELASYDLANDLFTPADACLYMEQIFEMSEQEVEYVYCMVVDNSKRIKSVCLNNKGDIAHVDIDLSGLIIYLAITAAQGFAIFHNHPNQTWNASEDDVNTDALLANIGHLLNIEYLGFYIVGSTYYTRVGEADPISLPL